MRDFLPTAKYPFRIANIMFSFAYIQCFFLWVFGGRSIAVALNKAWSLLLCPILYLTQFASRRARSTSPKGSIVEPLFTGCLMVLSLAACRVTLSMARFYLAVDF